MENNEKGHLENKQRISEKAINHKETNGKKINKHDEQRQDKHQPRDNA